MEKDQVENFNETKLKRILINFERKHIENQKLRIKHCDEPTKFAVSETELFAALDELQSVATQPELYHVLIAKKTVSTLLALLMHENSDISAKIIGMLQEFTDIDDVDEQEVVALLIKALDENNVIDLLVTNLNRLDVTSKEESLAINNSLAIIDNLIDFDPKFASQGSKSLISWIVKQLKNALEFNSIKLSMSELLSVLLLNSHDNKLLLGQMGGIDALLQQVAYYRRVAPVTGDEHEFLEQTINCLCTAILECEENRKSFYEEEGVDLIQLILREKRSAVKKSNIKISTLKLFNHVLTTDKNRDPLVTQCCERFVQVLGLRVLFPIFNNPKVILSEKTKKREYHQVLDEAEEHTAAILLALLKYCQDPELLQRVLIKFAEANFEKLNRLLDLHEKYYRLVSAHEDNGEDNIEHDKDYEEEKSKSSIHFTLRTIDYIILLTCYLSNHFETYDPNSGETLTNRLTKILSDKRVCAFKHQIILEVKKHIEEVADSSHEEQNSLELLLDYFEQLSTRLTKETTTT